MKRHLPDFCYGNFKVVKIGPDNTCREKVLEGVETVVNLQQEANMMQNIKEDNEQHKVRGLKFAVEHPETAQKNTTLRAQPFQIADANGNVPGSIPISTQAESLPIFQADSDTPRNDQNVELKKNINVDFRGMSEQEVYNMFSGKSGLYCFVFNRLLHLAFFNLYLTAFTPHALTYVTINPFHHDKHITRIF